MFLNKFFTIFFNGNRARAAGTPLAGVICLQNE